MKTRHLLGVPALLAVVIVASVQGARAGPVQDFTAYASNWECAVRPSTATSTSASTPLAGVQAWQFGLLSQLSPSSASITVNSGYSPSSLFLPPGGGCSGTSVTSLPVTFSGLACCNDLSSNISLKQAPGFASTTSVKPAKVPKGGTKQTVVATFRLTNPALDQQLKLGIASSLSGTSVLSASYTGPAGFGITRGSGSVEFDGNNPVLNTLYKFTVVLHVPNPGKAFTDKPQFDFLVIGTNSATIDPGPATTETIAVPTLDGGTSGSGSAVYAVTGATGSWEMDTAPTFDLIYLSSFI
jgi:hypothetical protein